MPGTVFVNGPIWTGLPAPHRAYALAVRDGRIAALDGPALALAACSERIDLDGSFLMPAFGDGHAHPILGALESFGPAVRGLPTIEAAVRAVAEYARSHPDTEWISGGGYASTIAPGGQFDARWLDTAVADRPVVLRSADYHSVWCNSEALRRAGITSATAEPAFGHIERHADNSPLGTLREPTAYQLVLDLLPPPPATRLSDAVTSAARQFAAAGVTFALDAWVDPGSGFLDAYLDVAARADPLVRFGVAWRATPSGWRELRGDIAAERDRLRAAAVGDLVTADTVKFFVDGVLMAGTAAMLEPYDDQPDSRGLLLWPPTELADAVARFDGDHLDVHLHAVGDRAVRVALDAIAHAQAVNPPWPRRPTVCHLQIVSPEDLRRLAWFGVTANFEPFWAQHDDFDRLLTLPRIGARGAGQFPMRAALDLGASVSFGSDWPVSTLHPLDGIDVAVNGCFRGGAGSPRRSTEQRIPVDRALSAYTSGVAHQVRCAHRRGTLTVGADADLVQLSADPFANTDAISTVRVVGTWLGGRRTFP